MDTNRVFAKIDLDNIIFNVESMKRNLPNGINMLAVLKTNGYGHGAVPIAKVLTEKGLIKGCAVATIDEALELRRAGIKDKILILGYTFKESYEALVQNEICPTVISYDEAKALSEVGTSLNKDVYCHIKIDTGMGRIGYRVNAESADEIARIFKLPHLISDGIFTHFAKSDEKDMSYTQTQFDRLLHMIEMLSERGIHFNFKHCDNSAGILRFPQDSFNMVRAGITLYGLWPSKDVDHSFPLRAALSLYAKVAFVKDIPENTPISYGGTFVSKKPMRIATIPIGYGDGYARSLSNKGYVLIHGKKACILGRVCMDQMMVDVSDIEDVNVGDLVTLIGSDSDLQITLEELGDLSGRFNYEFASLLGNRIPRLYYLNGELVDTQEYFDLHY